MAETTGEITDTADTVRDKALVVEMVNQAFDAYFHVKYLKIRLAGFQSYREKCYALESAWAIVSDVYQRAFDEFNLPKEYV